MPAESFIRCNVGFSSMLVLWIIAGFGQSLAEIPSETLIGENIAEAEQGKVYGSHFAFSHLWWAIAYPIAGFVGSRFPDRNFLYGGLLSLGLLLVGFLLFRSKGYNQTSKHSAPNTLRIQSDNPL